MEKGNNYNNNSNRVGVGLVIVVMGLIFFCNNIGIGIPRWVISWHMLLILIGLLVGYKRNFDGGGWLVMVLIGGYFTIAAITDINLSKYYLPIGLITLGLFLILKPKRRKFSKEKWKKKFADFGVGCQGAESPLNETPDENDVIESINVFGGSNQKIYSKNFKGGDVIAIFGGCDVNLSQADFDGVIVLELVAIFGGVKIIVPSNWEVKSELTAIFGGIEDKRGHVIVPEGSKKILKIRGVALFGGVDIKNF